MGLDLTSEQRRVAWRTTAMGITSIVAAKTRAKAVYTTWYCANDVGHKVKFSEIRAVRAPLFDGWARDQSDARRCHSEEYIWRNMYDD